MASREFLMAVTESAYGTPTTSPVLNTDRWYFNLPESDSFAGLQSPNIQEISYGGGEDVSFEAVSDHNTSAITWKGIVYPSVDNFLLNLALARVNSGQTTPWTTTEPPGDLASASFYKAWTYRGSATPVRKRWAGGKMASLSLECSRSNPILKFNASIICQKEVGNPVDSSSDPDSTEFPAPTDAQLPTGPYLLSHSATNLLFNSSAVTNYQSVSFRVTNKLDPMHFENHFVSTNGNHGQEATLTFQRLLGVSPNYRTSYQTVANYPVSLEFDNGINSFKIDMGAKCHVSAYAQQLANGKEFLETITVKGKYDSTNGGIVALTFT